MISSLNSKQIVVTVGFLLISIGLIGLLLNILKPSINDSSHIRLNQQSSLEVKVSNNSPTSTVDILQGSGGIQPQGSQPQDANASNGLQPNAGVGSLPRNY